MHLPSTLLLGASFIVAVVSQNIKFTNSPGLLGVTAGQPTNLTWSGGDGTSPVTITLKKGDPTDLQTIAVITGNANGNSFIWTPSRSLPNANDYALQISQGLQDINYSGEFPLTGGATSVSTTGSAFATSLSPASSSTSVSAALSSLNGTISSILSSQSVILLTTTLGTASSAGTGIPISRNTTFVSQSLSAAASTTGGLQGGPPTTTTVATTATSARGSSSPSASTTSGASTDSGSSSLALVLSVVAAMMYLN